MTVALDARPRPSENLTVALGVADQRVIAVECELQSSMDFRD
jgi:hypothetical protein